MSTTDYPLDQPNGPEPRQHQEYEDPHFHDADDVEPPSDDDPGQGIRPPLQRKPMSHRPPTRRRHYED